MRVRVAVVLVLLWPALASCTRGPDVELVTDQVCAGFTPSGPDLGDDELLDAAVADWESLHADGVSDPKVCVLYAGPSGQGDVVVMAHDGMVATYESSGDDPTVGHVVAEEWGRDDLVAVALDRGRWLLADSVTSVRWFDGPGAGTALDLDDRLVEHDRPDEIVVELVVGDRVHWAAPYDTDGVERLAVAPLVGAPFATSRMTPTDVLAVPGGVALLAAAIQDARWMHGPDRRPGSFEPVALTDVPGVGRALLSRSMGGASATDPRPVVLVERRDQEEGVVQALHVGTPEERESGTIWPRMERDESWSASAVLTNDGRPVAFVAAAQGAGARPVRLELFSGATSVRRPGPLAAVSVTSAGASLVARAPGIGVLPTQPLT